MQSKHKVFICYHHANDQHYKEELLRYNDFYDLFIDGSVDTGDIDEDLPDESIRRIIRDDYLQDSTVTIVLVGIETKKRKHVDWEIYSSMYDGKINKRSGILVINLPETGCNYHTAAHGELEKNEVYPEVNDWMTVKSRKVYENRYPYLPDRIIDNLLKQDVKVSVTDWERMTDNCEKLRFLIDSTYSDRTGCNYDLSRSMRRSNS